LLKDYSQKGDDEQFVRYINRWDVTKADPSADVDGFDARSVEIVGNDLYFTGKDIYGPSFYAEHQQVRFE
jgi:hypothetical protein